jgi:hypothetical protein
MRKDFLAAESGAGRCSSEHGGSGANRFVKSKKVCRGFRQARATALAPVSERGQSNYPKSGHGDSFSFFTGHSITRFDTF